MKHVGHDAKDLYSFLLITVTVVTFSAEMRSEELELYETIFSLESVFYFS